MRLLIKIISCLIPVKPWRKKFRSNCHNYIDKKLCIKQQRKYKKIIKKLRKKVLSGEKVKVGFVFLSNLSTNPFWTYLYDEFKKDDRFEPYMIIAPYCYLSKNYLLETTQNIYEILNDKGYNVISGWDFEKDRVNPIAKNFKNSIIFFMDPYQHLTDKEFLIKTFTSTCLTYYVPYSYCIVNLDNATQMDPHKFAYKVYPETKLHIDLLKKHSLNKENIATFVGYLGSQKLLIIKKREYDWKQCNANVKKVIIAPHHLLGLGNFLQLHQTYIDIAEKYKNKISFVFKPHPIFQESLLKYWSQEKIDAYLKKWEDMPNTKIEFGDYENLFFTSDAMILDSGSFCAEYSLLNKPFLFLEKTPAHEFNLVGKKILEQQYIGANAKDIYNFIEMVILNNNDIKATSRKAFVDENLVPDNSNIANVIFQNTINDIYPTYKEKI